MTVLAIDFGTSNTVVCTLDPVTQTPTTLKLEAGSRCFEVGCGNSVYAVPSLVFIKEHNQLIFGETVRQELSRFSQPQRLFHNFKHDLAADYQPPPRQIDGVIYTTELASELFLKEIWNYVQHLQPSYVIFTVPVAALERYLNWFQNLAIKLEIPTVQLVDESTAAALGYAIQQPGSIVLVVDFGTGTLDLSLVRTVVPRGAQKVLRSEVLAKSDAYIGGVDVDVWIVEHYLQQIGSSRSEIKEIGWLNLLEIAERMKIQLSTTLEAKESWFDDENLIAHELHLDRQELEEIIETHAFLEQVRQAIDEVLAIAQSIGISKAQIEHVLLVGGSCQIPAVQQLISSYFGEAKVKLDQPLEAVAYGAASLGQIVKVENYLQHDYAIRLWEPHTKTYSYFTLFEKGTRYPCKRSEPLTLQVANEGQREIRLDIGEVAVTTQAEVTFDPKGRMTSSQLNKHSEFHPFNDREQVCVAHLDPPGQLGVDRIEVVFEVNEQRVLLATVKDLVTQRVLVDRGAIALTITGDKTYV